MQTIETTAQVTAQGILIIQVPVQLPAGSHSAVVVVDDRPLTPPTNGTAGKLPEHYLGEWPATLSLRREDIYTYHRPAADPNRLRRCAFGTASDLASWVR